jgi:hypothetical protein
MQTIKENAIRDYVSDIDFKSENWSLKSIKEDLRKFLGEEPAIDVIYVKDVMINEATKKPVEFLNVDKVEIIFYDIDEKFKKITINP